MIISSIELKNFRNFTQKKFVFGKSINVIFGFNGQGKTNILEAISVACLSKSFRTRNDGDLLQHDKEKFLVLTKVVLDNDIEKLIKVYFSKSNGKKIEVENSRIKSLIELFGTFPIVILSPEDDIITTGPPQERRRFVNFVLSQLDKKYLKTISDYERTLKQRNKILQDARENRYQFAQKIEPWNERIFQLAKSITEERIEFINVLEKRVQPIHQDLSAFLEKGGIFYDPSFKIKWKNFEDFKKVLEDIKNEEIIKGKTIIGPHRDEINFTLDDHDLRKYGSRGQHRSFLLALKIAVYKLIEEKKRETPTFLLDDVYSEIDEIREKAFNDYFSDLKQVFITTNKKNINFSLPAGFDKEIKYIHTETSKIKENNISFD